MPTKVPAHESISRHIIKKSQDNKVLLHSTGNYIQNPVINRNGKKVKKNMCVCVYIYIKQNHFTEDVNQLYFNKFFKRNFKTTKIL